MSHQRHRLLSAEALPVCFCELSASVCIFAALLPSCLHVLQVAGRGETKSVANGEFLQGNQRCRHVTAGLANVSARHTNGWAGMWACMQQLSGELVAPKCQPEKRHLILSLTTVGFFFLLLIAFVETKRWGIFSNH